MNRDIPTDKTRNRVKNPALGANRKFGSVKGLVVAVVGCAVVGCGVVGMYLIQFKFNTNMFLSWTDDICY